MLQYVRTGDGARQVVEWRQSFVHAAPFNKETHIVCPAQVRSRFMVVEEIRRQRSLEMA